MICVFSVFLNGLGLGLRIPCDIFALLASLSKIGFFNGIIDISAADILPIIIELNNNDFIKKKYLSRHKFTK